MVPAAIQQHGLSGNGGDIDDPAAPLGPHRGQYQLAEPGQAEDIDFLLAPGFVHRDRLDGSEIPVTGIVHQDIDLPLLLQHLLNARLHGSFVRDIHPDRDDAIRAKRFHQLDTPGRRIHAVPFFRERPGRIETDAAATAGNQDHFLRRNGHISINYG